MLEVLKPGTTVYIGEAKNIRASILSVRIVSCNRVCYEVGWWDKTTHEVQWLEEWEFSCEAPIKIAVGYVQDKIAAKE